MTDILPAHGHAARAGFAAPPGSPRDERLARAALHAALAGAPLATGSLAAAFASTTLLFHATTWHVAWAIVAIAALVAMAGSAVAAAHARTPRALAARCEHAYAPLGMLATALLGLAPWLPDPAAGPAAGSLLVLALGMSAIGAAAAFASLRGPAVLAAALPLSPAAADWWGAETTASVLPAAALAGALLAVVALAVSLACRRNWRRDARAAIEGGDRLRAREADRDAALRADRESRRVLAMASRDLRQPVNALGLFAAALEQRLRASGDESLVHNLVRSVDGLDRSLGAMLDLTRLEAATPGLERVALAEVFRRLATRFAPEAELAGLRLRFAAGAKTVEADPQMLERLLGHLVQDAMRRTARGGVTVVARRAGRQTHLEVWDTGGAPRPDPDAPSASAPPGLALVIAERLSQRLGCRLTTVARPGRGTRVRLALPARAPDAAPAASTVGATLGH